MFSNDHKIHFFLNRELGLLYFSHVLLDASKAFMTLFIPIFLYIELGIPIWLVVFLLALQYAVYGFMVYSGYRFSIKFGVKKLIAIGAVLYALAILSLLPVRQNLLFLIPYFLLYILHLTAFFPAVSIDETLFTEKGKRGRELSALKTVSIMMNSLIPVTSGLMITFLGFNYVFITALILAVLAAVPILFSKDEHILTDNLNIKNTYRFFKSYKNKREIISYTAEGFKDANIQIFWPLFLFILIPSYTKIGGITSIVVILSMVLTIWVGRYIDKKGTKKILKLGSYMQSANWGFKCLLWFLTFISSFQILFVSITHKFTNIFITMSVRAEFYDHADDKRNILKILYLRKFTRQMGRSLPFFIFAFIAYTIPNPENVIIMSFFLTIFTTLTIPFILIKK